MGGDPSILLLTRYGPLGSSSRLRMLQYIPALERAGFKVTVSPFFADAYLRRLYAAGRGGLGEVFRAYGRRLRALTQAGGFDLVWVEKELLPFLPAWFESALHRVGRPYVVDYDDATFHRYDDHASKWVRMLLGEKLVPLIASARLIIAGNSYLASYASGAGGREVQVLPTVIDLARYQVTADPGGGEFRVGWIGSPSTTKLLALVSEPLKRLARDGPVRLVTIGASRLPQIGVPVEEHPWSEDTESALLGTVHVGIMPLEDEPWQRGKCGYKLIQCMACGKPVVASPVGVNTDIVSGGVGLLANDDDQWLASLRRLAEDSSLRDSMGRAGRMAVERSYSLQVTAPRMVELLSGAFA